MDKENEKVIIAGYLESTTEEIERTIARILLVSEGVSTATMADEGLANTVAKYLSNRMSVFRQNLCVDWNLGEKIKSSAFGNNVELVAAIADVIAPLVGAPPALMVATLLFKRGLQELCKDV